MIMALASSEGGAGMGAAIAALQGGSTALDAVEGGIRPVEVDPAVRSVGLGGWPNLLGQMELDAAIMEGSSLTSGAVGALQGYRHPISVARQVMERLPHVMLVGDGARRFAAECGAEPGQGPSAAGRRDWENWLHRHVPAEARAAWESNPMLAPWARLTADPLTAHGTTILLARDTAGSIAVGVSTCGWAFKYPGRLGDSPIVGAGSYADSRYGAAACTGYGELTIRASTARTVVLYMKMGLDVAGACREAADDLRALRRDYAGGVTIHAIDREGQPYALSVGVDYDDRYWFWDEGMVAPERREPFRSGW